MFPAVHGSDTETNLLSFKPVDMQFTCGYVAAEHYVATINENVIMDSENYAFSIPLTEIQAVLPRWRTMMSFDL